ncbi:Rpn family recombination-promoting nuclease/putative transposase [Nocardia sp. BMG51109]|uniref:Rpn family recombination-promoting nuclease/putative transposase n=1 Tax=Nocardia sp. BMG51109 TaxID=1056816 RepID=UPI000464C975|nr:Rpn family recombination-promoting nuclease/putative transposase [Nocardia sp. BMG51109]
MAEPPKNPHDAYFRQVLSHSDAAAGELRAVLPEAVSAQIDWKYLQLQSCSFVPAELRSRYTDVLFRTRWAGRDAFVYLLVEHQSKTDRLMAFRMLEYVVAIWSRYLSENSTARQLPAVIPVVVHADPTGARWTAPTEVADLIDVDPGMRAALAGYLPRMGFVLDDLATLDVAALCSREPARVRVMLTMLKTAPGNRHLDRVLSLLMGDLKALAAEAGGRTELIRLMEYICTVGETGVDDLLPVVDRLGPETKEAMVTTAEQLRTEGRAEGRAEGQAEMLLDQLSLKFGPLPEQVVQSVRTADPARLRTMSHRVLTATVVDEVLAQ